MERKEWIDILKCFGILSVVIGHIFETRCVYIYHMPLFFILGGYLYKSENLKEYFKRKFINLIIPYISYLIILSILCAVKLLLERNYDGIITLVFNDIYGGGNLVREFGVFWFPCVYFLSLQLFNAIIVRKKSSVYFILFFIGSYFIPEKMFSLPYNIQVVPMATFLIWQGYLLKRINTKYLSSDIVVFLSALIIGLSIAYSDSLYVDMKHTYYGIPFVSILLSVLITICFASISVLISKMSISKLCAYIGVNSMCIMYLHQYIHYTLLDNVNIFFLFILAIAIPLMFSFLCNRFPRLRMMFAPTKADCQLMKTKHIPMNH